jgi:type VI secretion system Hcp family effector
MKKYAFLLFLPLALLAFVRPAYPTRPNRPVHPTAFDTYISFKGAKQGLIKGTAKGVGGREAEGWFQVMSFSFGGSNAATASQTGGSKGKSLNPPMVITKQADQASPKLLNAHVNNETFETVVLQTVGRPQTGAGEVVVETITLTNATISEYKTFSGSETISLIYEQMTRRK